MTGDDLSTLISRVALKDRRAFNLLYDATSSKLFGTCLRILRQRSDAEEALQEVFVKIWLKADRFAVTGHSPMTWLISVARHHAIDRLRARKDPQVGSDVSAEDLRDDNLGPEENVVLSSEKKRLDACLDQLDASHSEAVRSAYLDGMSYADLAAQFGVPINTMRTWLRRSLLRLRKCLQT